MSLEPPSAPSSTALTPSASPTPTGTSTSKVPPDAFTFPPQYSFRPFFTLQPNATTRASQLSSWSSLIQSYCRHRSLFSLTLIDAISTPLFRNEQIAKSLSLRDARFVLAWMSSAEGGRRAEFAGAGEAAAAAKTDFTAVPGSGANAGAGAGEAGAGAGAGKVWIYWRRPEEWADMLERWVDATGQKGAVLTLYELTESDAVRKEEWSGMEAELLRKSLQVLVKKGRAQVFGQGDDLGVKFF